MGMKSRNKTVLNIIFKNILGGLHFNPSFEKHLKMIPLFNMLPFTITHMIFNKLLLCFLEPGSGLKTARSVRGEASCLSSFSKGLKSLL